MRSSKPFSDSYIAFMNKPDNLQILIQTTEHGGKDDAVKTVQVVIRQAAEDVANAIIVFESDLA